MGLLEIILIALGLAMDAFAVSVTLGLSVKKLSPVQLFIPAAFFGFFQALMPLIGWIGGNFLTDKIESVEHWVAFILLSFVGGMMIKDSFSKEEEKNEENPFKSAKMLLLAIATSIDALAVGVTYAFFKDVNIITAIIITGAITFVMCIGGVKIGNIFGAKYKSKAELFGGIVLIGLGIKILIEGLFFK